MIKKILIIFFLPPLPPLFPSLSRSLATTSPPSSSLIFLIPPIHPSLSFLPPLFHNSYSKVWASFLIPPLPPSFSLSFLISQMKSKSRNNANAEISFSRRLLVGNTHALFNPSRGDIKLGQIRLLVETTHRISREWGNIPVVIAGDLNSTPQSAIYQFLASSELNILLHDRKKMSGQIEGEARWGTCRSQTEFRKRWSREELQLAAGSERTTHLYHHLQLRSAYNGVPGSSSTRDRYGEPLATTYHSKFMGTVDYIWHSKEFHPVGVVETLPIDILRQTGGLPSEKWGSDHLALVCELAFVDDSKKT